MKQEGATSTRVAHPDRPGGLDAEDRVIEAVVAAVQSRRHLPGDRLIERELSDECQVGRLAIRNALQRLATAGLVEITRNKGARVKRLTVDEAGEVFELRIVIEGAALRKLAGNLDDEACTAFQEALRAENAAFEDGRVEEARHASRRFHILIGKLSGNRYIATYLADLINCQPLLLTRRGGKVSQFSGHSAHIKTFAALSRGDGEEAARLNSELLESVFAEMTRDIEQGNADEADNGENA